MPTTLNGLSGTIDHVTVFGETLLLSSTISKYLGDTMYIKTATVDNATKVLSLMISNEGPPLMPAFASGSFTSATVSVEYRGGTVASAATTKPIAYGGMPLLLTGTVTMPAAGKYTNANIVPVISEWAKPERGLEYIVVQQSYTNPYPKPVAPNPPPPVPPPAPPVQNELRWFSTSIDVHDVTPSANPIPMPTGFGVQGPFGIETP